MTDPNELVSLGRTGITIPRLGVGSAPLARPSVDEASLMRTFDAVTASAPVLVDTAPYYGIGVAETRVGIGLAGRWDRVVLSTKVGRLVRPDANGKPMIVEDYSYDGAMRSLEESMRRLGTDRIDIVHIHDPDNHFEAAISGVFKALDQLRSDGTIRAVSAGMNQFEMLSRFMDHADFDCFLLAGRYTLLERLAEQDFLPKVQAAGIGLILGGVFNSGVLADPRPGVTYNYVPAPDAVLEQARRLESICAAHGVPLKAAALQFPLRHPAVSAILVGIESADQWSENQNLMRLPIPDELWREIDAYRMPQPLT